MLHSFTSFSLFYAFSILRYIYSLLTYLLTYLCILSVVILLFWTIKTLLSYAVISIVMQNIPYDLFYVIVPWFELPLSYGPYYFCTYFAFFSCSYLWVLLYQSMSKFLFGYTQIIISAAISIYIWILITFVFFNCSCLSVLLYQCISKSLFGYSQIFISAVI